MSTQDYLRVLRERWMILVAAIIVGLLAAGATFLLRPAEYTAHVSLYVAAQTGGTATGAYQGSLLSQQRVKSYVELVSSTRVSREVIRRLNLTGTPEGVAKQITATSAVDSVLIDVAVAERDPAKSAAVANAVGDVFSGLVDQLERPSTPNGIQAVAVRVVQPATAPASPSSTGLPVLLVLGLLGGLAVGVGGALARNALDTSVKAPEHLRDAARAPNLGMIAFDAKVPKHPLTVHEDPQSPRSEAFRQLRTNLQFVDVDNPRKVIVVTSSLPEEGKTTILVNLAIALASAGQRVLVVEADLRRPKVADLLGLERSVGLTSVLDGQVRPEQAIQTWSAGPFDVLASGPLPPNPSELLGSLQMRVMLAGLRERYDMVLVDTPPLLPVTDAAAVAPATDGVLLMCRFKKTSRAQVASAAEALRAGSAPLLGTVFTMLPASGSRAYAQHHANYRNDAPVVPATVYDAPHSAVVLQTQAALVPQRRPVPYPRGQE